MSCADEEWVKAAMSDDAMVVELLVRLHRPKTPQTPHRVKRAAALPHDWSVRQRRSKSGSVNNNNHPSKPAHRASPTTPLSWSGATSISGGSVGAPGGGFEESSQPPPFKLPNATRSKVNGDSEKTPAKRSRKKKTVSQLKEEENMLVKERIELNREITALRVKLEKQRETFESLKRMKIEMKLDKTPSSPEESVSVQFMPSMAGDNITSVNMDAMSNPKFTVPDLNMPFEDSIHDDVCGVS